MRSDAERVAARIFRHLGTVGPGGLALQALGARTNLDPRLVRVGCRWLENRGHAETIPARGRLPKRWRLTAAGQLAHEEWQLQAMARR